MKNKYDLNQRKRPLSPLRLFLIWGVFIVCSLPLTTALQAQVVELVAPEFPGSFGLGKWSGKTGMKNPVVNGLNLTSSDLVLNGTEDIFSNRSVYCAKFDSVSPQNTKGRFKIMDPEADSAIGTHDVNVLCDSLPFIPPGSGLNRSVRIGNVCGDGEAEGLFMDFLVTPANSLLTLYYSMVLEYLDDNNHMDRESPEFIMELRDKSTGQLLDSCMYLRISSYQANNSDIWEVCSGTSPLCGNNDGCIAYMPWRKAELNLTPFMGDTVTLSIKTGDCAHTAHYGYAYFAGSAGEFGSLEVQNCGIEETDTVARVFAPDSLGYNWYFGEISKPLEWIKVPKDRDGERVLSLLESDFDQYAADGYELPVVCNMGSKMNQDYSCASLLEVTVRNSRPKIIISETILGDLSRRFKNLSRSANLDTLDTSLTYWEVIEKGYDTVIYKNAHDSIDHQFNSEEGYKYVRLYVTPKDGNCSGKKTFRIITHPVKSVSLGLRELRATIGAEDTILHATVAPAKASNKMVNWQSTNTAVVKVDQTGKLQFIGLGTAFIIVTTLEGHFSDSLRIVVDDVSIAKVEGERISVKKQGKEVTITSIDQNQIEQLKVYDVAGRLLLQVYPKNTTYTFQVKEKVIIIIEIQLQDGIHIVKKIIG